MTPTPEDSSPRGLANRSSLADLTPNSSFISSNSLIHSTSSTDSPRKGCSGNCFRFTKTIRRATIFVLRSQIMSLVVIFLASAVCLGPAVYAFFFMTPKIIIDKSLNSFSIPNHPVSINYDAFKMAKDDWDKNTGLGRRKKREIPDNNWPGFPSLKAVDQETSRSIEENRLVNIKDIDSKLEAKKIINKIFKEQGFFGRVLKRFKRDTKCGQHCQTFSRWKMQLVYTAIGKNKNVFTKSRLEQIHKVETGIMNRKDFTKYCYRGTKRYPLFDTYNGCSPLNSLLTYFYPSQGLDGKIYYDGLGSELQNINQTLKFALTNAGSYWYVDENFNSQAKQSTLLRTEVQFGVPIAGYIYSHIKEEEQKKKVEKFMVDCIDFLKEHSNDELRILYGGNMLFDWEVDKTFWDDIKLAGFSLGFIVLFMFILTSFSGFLTFWGIYSILLSFPLALFFYRAVFKMTHLGILNGAAAFVIIGIGDLFLYVVICF